MRRWIATGLSLVCALLMTACSVPGRMHANTDCAAQEVRASDLIGVWSVELTDRLSAPAATPTARQTSLRQGLLVLQAHPDYPGSLRGRLQWPQGQSLIAADLDGDTFTMEESEDGQRIAATWIGALVAGHCGRRLEGVRLGDGGAATEGPAFSLQQR